MCHFNYLNCSLHIFFAGPVSSVLVNRFGCRPVVILGGLMCGLSMVAASFGTSIMYLYFFIGFIGGTVLIINIVFFKFRSLFMQDRVRIVLAWMIDSSLVLERLPVVTACVMYVWAKKSHWNAPHQHQLEKTLMRKHVANCVGHSKKTRLTDTQRHARLADGQFVVYRFLDSWLNTVKK